MGATVYWADGNELATITVTFTGTPTSVVLTVTDPTGTTSTPSMSGSGAGPYTANVASTIAGIWSYLIEGTGTASDAIAGTWTVSSPALNKLYCTSEELKSRLGIPDTGDDFEVQLAVEAASRSIDEVTGRYFYQVADTRTYIPESIYRQNTDDLVSVTTLKVDFDGDGVYETTWTQGTDYVLEVAPGRYNTSAKGEKWPYTGFTILGPKLIPYTWPWSHLDRIQITGVFGWPAVPSNVKQAALIAAADLFKIKDAPLGVVGFGEFGAIKVAANPRVMQLLRRYINGQRVGV